MTKYPLETIKAPALLFLNGSCVLIKDSIKVTKTTTRSDIVLSNNVKAAERVDAQKIEIKGSPVAFSKLDVLFKELSLVKGSLLPRISNCYIAARVASGKWVKWSFLPAVHSGIGSITFGANNPMGEHTWTIFPDPENPTKPLFESSEMTSAPTVPSLTDAGKFMLRCLGVYGSGDDKIEFDTDGASIDISLSTEDAQNDRLLKYGLLVSDIQVNVKLKPRGISYADWTKLSEISQTDELGSIQGVGTLPSLVLRGVKKGDFTFTAASARVKDPSATFSAKDPLMDELTFEALGDYYGDNKLTIGTASADFEFETAATQNAGGQTKAVK